MLTSPGLRCARAAHGGWWRGRHDVPWLGQTLPALPVAEDSSAVEIERLASDVLTFEFGPPHACTDPFDDEAPFQLSDDPDDHDDRPAQRAAGIDLFSEADELDVQPVQLIEDFEEVFRGPGDPVAGPDQYDVEPTAASIAHQLIQTGAARLRAADPVFVLFDDLIAALAGHLLEIEELGFGMLVEG